MIIATSNTMATIDSFEITAILSAYDPLVLTRFWLRDDEENEAVWLGGADVAFSIAPLCGPDEHDRDPDAARPSTWFQAEVVIDKRPPEGARWQLHGLDPGTEDTRARLLAALENLTQDPPAAHALGDYVRYLVGERLGEFARLLRERPHDPGIEHRMGCLATECSTGRD